MPPSMKGYCNSIVTHFLFGVSTRGSLRWLLKSIRAHRNVPEWNFIDNKCSFFPPLSCIKSGWEHFGHSRWPLAHSSKLLILQVWKKTHCFIYGSSIYTYILQFWEDPLIFYVFAGLHLPRLPEMQPAGSVKNDGYQLLKMKNESRNHRLARSSPWLEPVWLEKVGVLCLRKKTVLKWWH